MKRAVSPGAVVVCLLSAAAPAVAQEDPSERIGPPPVQYNFAPPGARSLALGAAFIGLADDATASESNPAGLTILTKPEVSAHLRYTEFDSTVPNTVTAVGFDTFRARLGSPSFFSVVYPWRKLVVSLYYQRADVIVGHIYFLLPSGAWAADDAFSLGPKQTAVINTAGVPGVNGVSGAIRIAHNGRYASLVGKTVALEPATGFSFDSALEARPK